VLTSGFKGVGAVLLIILAPLPILGDDLVMKDGRRVPWKSLVDEGESYAVETKDGQKLKVKKAEIERIAFDESLPLTGATFTLDRKRSVSIDLLAKPPLPSEDKSWKAVPGGLLGTTPAGARPAVVFDFGPLPEEYDLSLTLELKEDAGEIAVGIVGGGKQVLYHFDAYGGTKSCLGDVGGANGDTIVGRVFQRAKPRTARFMVRRQALIVQVDEKDFYTWRADWSKVSIPESYAAKAKDRLFLVACGGTWKVSAASVTRPK